MAQTKRIDQGRWSEFLSMLSNGNRGRTIAIEVIGMDVGDQPVTDAAPLFAIDYDPAGKGDNVVISTGRQGIDYAHTIAGPSEIWESQDENGKLRALEIVARDGTKTIVAFTS